MKLVKHTTTDFGATDIFGNVARSNHWGRKHYFIIENAQPCELEAVEELLLEMGWDTDRCPCYEDGFGAGFHIEIEEVEAFKADYKIAKGRVAARVSANRAAAQGEALAAMPTEEIEAVVRVAVELRTSLRKKSESLSGLRAIRADRELLNPYITARNPLSRAAWALVAECLSVGTVDDVCLWLSALVKTAELKTEARAVAETVAVRDTSNAEQFQLTFRLSCPVTQRRTVEAAHVAALEENATRNTMRGCKVMGDYLRNEEHAEALRINADIDRDLALLGSDIAGCRREFDGAKLDEMIWQRIRNTAARIAQLHHVALAREFYVERFGTLADRIADLKRRERDLGATHQASWATLSASEREQELAAAQDIANEVNDLCNALNGISSPVNQKGDMQILG